MNDGYLIVDKRILPEYYEKVVKARELLSVGKVKDVSEAARLCGISRSTYYKYKDHVFRPADEFGRKAVIAMMLGHEKGVLSEVLNILSYSGANILTITQSLPVNGRASVVISLDMSHMDRSMDDTLQEIAALSAASGVKLIAVE